MSIMKFQQLPKISTHITPVFYTFHIHPFPNAANRLLSEPLEEYTREHFLHAPSEYLIFPLR